MVNPFELKIHNQAEDEQILHIWRHHRITLVGPVLRVVSLMLVPTLLAVITGFSMFSSPWLFGIFLVIVGITLTYAAYEWASWYGDVYVMTNYRIIDVEQTGFFHRKMSEASLNRIQDVSFQISGVWQTFFDYGTVLVQTAGAVDNVDMNNIANPAYQTKLLLQQQEKYHESGSQEMSAEELITLLNKHHKDLEKLPDMEKEENLEKTREQLKKVQEKSQQKKSFRKKKQEAE